MASGQRDGRIELIDTRTGPRLGPALSGHKGGVQDLDFSPDGEWLATLGEDQAIRLWHNGPAVPLATDVIHLGDGVTLAAVDRRGSVHLWDAVTARRLNVPWAGHQGASWRIARHAHGERYLGAEEAACLSGE